MPVPKKRTAEQAVAELRALTSQYGSRTRGSGGLTQRIIAEQVGITPVTVSWWISEGANHHDPQGLSLTNLCRFLDKAKNKDWIAKITAKGAR